MSIASEITRIQNAKAALKNSINAKTDISHQIDNETLEDYASFVDTISGGGYDGQLPNNSSISKIINVGSELRVYLSVDALASGTRVYYKENEIPSLNDSYIDVPVSAPYAVIPNVNLNSMYGIRVAAYIIYDENQKAFNNANTVGSYAIKLTTQFNPSGAVLLDIPLAEQGTNPTQLVYSKYNHTVYATWGSKLYKLDLNDENNLAFVRICEGTTFSGYRLMPTSEGLFLGGSSYIMHIDYETEQVTQTVAPRASYITQISNGDILSNDNNSYCRLYKWNKNNKQFEDLINSNIRIYSYANHMVDCELGIYILVYNANESNRGYIYTYNQTTNSYEVYGALPTSVAYNTLELYNIVPIMGGLLFKLKDKFYIKNGTNMVALNMIASSSQPQTLIPLFKYSNYGNVMIQIPEDPNTIYYVNGNYLYKFDIGTNTNTQIQSGNGGILTYYDDIIFTITGNSSYGSRAYKVSTQSTISTNISNNNAELIKVAGKLYLREGSTLKKYVKNGSSFSWQTIQDLNSNGVSWYWFENNNYLYIMPVMETNSTSYNPGVWRLNTNTDEVIQLITGKFNKMFQVGSKLYILQGSEYGSDTNYRKQFVVNLDDDTCYESDYNSGRITSTAIGLDKLKYTSYDYSYFGIDAIKGIFLDTTNNKLNTFDDMLLDLSASSESYTRYETQHYMYCYYYMGLYFTNQTKNIIIVGFDNPNNMEE